MKQSFGKKLLIFLLSFLVIERFCRLQTQGFRMCKVAFVEEADEAQCFPLQAFDQSYDYLGSGAQFYVFASRDRSFVLKLFKTHHGLFASKEKKKKRLLRLFTSAKLAQELLPMETGILFLHLAKTKDLYGKVTIYDPLQIAHSLNLDCTAFILQKYAEPAAMRLQAQLDKENIIDAKTSMKALLDLAENTALKGIKNKDIKLIRNCGFVGDLPLILDIGSLSIREGDSSKAGKKVRKKATIQLHQWLLAYYPKQKELLS